MTDVYGTHPPESFPGRPLQSGVAEGCAQSTFLPGSLRPGLTGDFADRGGCSTRQRPHRQLPLLFHDPHELFITYVEKWKRA